MGRKQEKSRYETNVNITEIFNYPLIIPKYQRGYSWELKQLDDFWDDIQNLKDNNTLYFGTFYLSKNQNYTPDNNYYDVIDGQQRLTTIVILLSCIEQLDCYNKIRDEIAVCIDQFSYSASKEDDFLKGKILGDNNVTNDITSVYRRNLFNAKKFFNKKLNDVEFSSKSELKKLFYKLKNSIKIDICFLSDTFNVQTVFETLNNRGKPLTILEKLKNRLMFLANYLSETDLIDNINERFSEIYTLLGSKVSKILDEDDFVSAHLTIIRKPLNDIFSAKSAEEKLFQIFNIHSEKFPEDEKEDYETYNSDSVMEQSISKEKIDNYLINLIEFCKVWIKVCNFDKSLSETARKVLLLNPTKASKILLSTVIMIVSSEKQQEEIIEKLEFINFRLTIPGAWCKCDSFADLARKLNTEKNTDNLLNKLNECIKIEYDKSAIITGIKDLFNYQRGNIGFYRWSGIKYFLYEYECSLAGKKKKIIQLEDFSDESIEHIFPQKPEEYWKDLYEEIKRGRHNQDFVLGIVTNSLGNLTLLSARKNIELKNYSWEYKKKEYSKHGSSYSEKDIASNYGYNWTVRTIYKRGLKMLSLFISKLQKYETEDGRGKKIVFSESEKKQLLLFDNRFDKLLKNKK